MYETHISCGDLNLLTVFAAIHAWGGAARAAEAPNLSQPPYPTRRRGGATRVGDPPFVRRGGILEPSPTARQMTGPIQGVPGAIDATIAGLSGFDPAIARAEMPIGMHPMLEGALFAALASRALREAPGVALAVERRAAASGG